MSFSKPMHRRVRAVVAAGVFGACAANAAAQVPANCPQWIVTMFASFQPVQGRTPPKVPSQAQCDASRYTNGKWQSSDVSVFIGDLITRAKQNPTQYVSITSQLGSTTAAAGATPSVPGTAPQQSGASAPTASGTRSR